jgi:hypothetical protein
MQSTADYEEFLDKWRDRWPEWRIAQPFIEPTQHARAQAWFALLQELTDAAWSGADPTPGIAKLGWWQEELRGWAKGARRHPLGIDLHKLPAPWPPLASALTSLQAVRESVRGGDSAAVGALVEALRPCAYAIDACERVLFGDMTVAASVEACTAGNVARQHQSNHAGIVLIALYTLWASADAPDPVRHADRARALLAAWPQPAAVRPRRVYDALIRRRLRTIAAGSGLAPLSPWATLWTAWRAARL